ncbi:MAG: TRAP transporter substrate-binding protein DctP [Thermodesulfobacteriota bacterium]
MKNRRGLLTAILAAACLLLLGPAALSASVLKIASLSPDGSFWMEKMREGARKVEEKTAGRVTFRFYPGGVMGDDKAVLRKIRAGQLAGGAVMAGSLAKVYSDSKVYNLPFCFRSLEEVDFVRSRMDPELLKGFEANGFVVFGIMEGGFAYVLSQEPLRNLEDLKRQKMWVPDYDDTAVYIVKSFGVTPIPLPLADVLTGLQTGLINTTVSSPIGAVALQWHTQVRYLIEAPVMYLYAVLAVDRKDFEKLSPEDQKIVREEMGKVCRIIDKQNRADNVAATGALKKQGISFISPQGTDLDAWYRQAEAVVADMVKRGMISASIVERLNRDLAEFRAGRKK